MEISVGDELDSFECLKLKLEEIECISNCIFVTENSNTVENGAQRPMFAFRRHAHHRICNSIRKKPLNDRNKQVKCKK